MELLLNALSVIVRKTLAPYSVGSTRIELWLTAKEKEKMQTNQKKKISSYDHPQEWRDSCNTPDPMDPYWEKLRVDGQFSRWQKPATD